MAKTYRLGVIGFAHMHINSLMRSFKEVPNVEWVACADTVPEVPEIVEGRSTRAANMKFALNEIGIPKAYDDYREMLQKEKFDLVLFNPENAKHGEVAEAIGAAGANMLTEKPMAASLPGRAGHGPSGAGGGRRAVRQLADHLVGADPKGEGARRSGRDRQGLGGPNPNGLDGPTFARYLHPAVGRHRARDQRGREGPDLVAPRGNGRRRAARLLLLRRLPLAVVHRQASAGGVRPNGQRQQPVGLGRGQRGDNGSVPRGPRGPRGDLEHDRSRNAVGPVHLRHDRNDRRRPAGRRAGRQDPPRPQRRARDRLGWRAAAGRETLGKEIINHFETGEPVHETLQPDFNLDAEAILDAGIRSSTSGKMELVNNWTWGVG